MGKGGRAVAGRKAATAKRSITWKELAQHNTKEDAWIAWGGKVYDVSGWSRHPGGDVIFTHAGKDATGVFEGFHPESAYAMMDTYCIGELSEEPQHKWEAFEADVREVRAKLQREGYFDANPVWYTIKTLSTVAFAVVAWWLVLSYDSFVMHMLSAAFLAIFLQQCGWLAHDYVHHQVFKWRLLGDAMGWLVGNVFQGFSVGPSKFHRFQHLAFWVLVMGARLAWAHQSLLYVFGFSMGWGRPGRTRPLAMGAFEHAGLLLHWAWYGALMLCMPWTHALAYTFIAQAGCGVMLAVAFAVGHNGMTIYEHANPPPFSVYQITTTRNVHDVALNGWFMGGLHYQIEHHLFPSLPRHSLAKAASLVKPLAEKHGVPYHCTGLWEGTMEVVGALHEVGQAVADFP
ncbi:unnamed protein product, partial [Symbiodinium sp. KB8]